MDTLVTIDKDEKDGFLMPVPIHPPPNLKFNNQFPPDLDDEPHYTSDTSLASTSQREYDTVMILRTTEDDIEEYADVGGTLPAPNFDTTNKQALQNGVDKEYTEHYDRYRIQHQLSLRRERWHAKRQRPAQNTILNISTTKRVRMEYIEQQKLNATSLRHIEVRLNLKGKLINGRQIFIHIFGTNRIEPKRNVIKWSSKLTACLFVSVTNHLGN